MKRFSLVCCLVLLLNMFCPAVHVHAEEITTPSDLPCEHTEVVEMHDADYHWNECASCQTVIGSKIEHFGSVWWWDEDNHWTGCQGCGEPTSDFIMPHASDCGDPTACTTCPYKGVKEEQMYHSIDWSNMVYQHDEKQHWYPCYCGETKDFVEDHVAYCGDPNTCGICGAALPAPMATKHKYTYEGSDGHDATYHWYNCELCGEVALKEKHWNWCTLDPTLCDRCPDTTGLTIARMDHDTGLQEGVHDTATHETVCKYCETRVSQLSTAITVEATCTSDGSKTVTCSVCGVIGTETIPSTGHSYEWRSDATGYHWEFCTKCQLMQNYGEHYALCSAEDQSVCDLCGKTVDDGSMVLIHDYTGMPWEYDAEAHWQNCFCGEAYPDHWVHDVYCTDPDAECFCGYVGEVGWIQHNFNYNEATYIDADSHLVVCEDCGAEEIYSHWSEDCLTDICVECGGTFEGNNHMWPEQYEYDEDGHWFVCEMCNETVNDEAHWYTCTAPDTCELCGYKTTGATDFYHYWTTTYEKDNAYYHYKKCPECGEDYEFYAHIVSCADPDVCLTCGATGVDMDNVSHGEIKWEHNDTKHWGVCTVCNEIMEEGKHWTDCSKPDLCQDCGAKNVTIDPDILSHFDVEWGSYEKDATHHWYTCRSCNVKAFYEEHYVSCTEKGICSACGIAGEFEVSHDVLKPGWESDATNHWKVCAVCDEAANKAAHADTDNDGKCDACQVSVAHVHAWGEPVIVAATCTTDGSKTTACATCGEKTVEAIKAADHAWGETVIVDATCAADGSKTTACTACGEETVEVIPAHDQHTWKTVANVAATCTKQGRVEKVCTVCDETSIVNPAAKGHSYGLVFTTQGNGTHAKTCADCGAKRTEDCVLTSTEVGSMTCSACATCGYTVYTMNDAALENTEDVENAEELANAKAETTVKRVENVSFELVPVAAEEATEAEAETAAEPVDYSDVVLVVHETVVEMKVELPDTVNAEVKKVLAVSLLKEGASIQPSSKVKLSIPVVEEEVAGLKLVLMTETGELIELEYEIIDGVMIFETEMVGVFLFVDAVE